MIGILFLSLKISAQTSFFSPTLTDYRSSGWTLSLGGSGLGGSHTDFQEEWLTANSTSGAIDTAYSGTWTPDGGLHLTGGIGRVWIAKKPLLADRFSLSFIGSKRSIVETFKGRARSNEPPPLPFPPNDPVFVIDSTLTGNASSVNLGIYGSALRAIPLSPDIFVELGIGASVKYDFLLEEIAPPLTRPALNDYSPLSSSLEFIAGAGVMMWRNRYVRVQFATDILQIAPINGSAKLPWMVGDYRPYRFMMSIDLFGIKPVKAEGSCAAPTHSEKAKELFGKEMRGWGKAKNRSSKRKKSRK